MFIMYFFFNDTATTEIYTLSLHDALPISGTVTAQHLVLAGGQLGDLFRQAQQALPPVLRLEPRRRLGPGRLSAARSEEHTSELQSRQYLVCRLLLEKKN